MISSSNSTNCLYRYRSTERGIALVSVLWALLLVSALAASSLYMARINAIIVHREPQIARAEAAADAAIYKTIADLTDEQAFRHPAINGSAQAWEFDGIPITISITNEDGRIDVNSADALLLMALLRSKGIDQDTAQTMIDDLRNRQNADNTPGVRGADKSADLTHGVPVTTLNGPLDSIDELQRIPSWKAQGARCWSDALTVYSGLPGVNESDATAPVLAALLWAQENHVGGHDWISPGSQGQSVVGTRSYYGEVLRIRVDATLTGVKSHTEWAGRVTGDPQKPMLTIKWDRIPENAGSHCVEAQQPK